MSHHLRLTSRPELPSLVPQHPARVEAECRELRRQIITRFDRWADIELSRGNLRIAEQLSRRAEELRSQFGVVSQ